MVMLTVSSFSATNPSLYVELGMGGVWVRLCYVWFSLQVRSCLALSECPCLGNISEFPRLNKKMWQAVNRFCIGIVHETNVQMS